MSHSIIAIIKSMKRPPGPRGREVLGFLGRGDMSRTLRFLQETARRFGPISYFRFLNQQIYVLDDPALIQEVLITRQHSFRRDSGATILRELVGDGLMTRDQPQHRERRRLMQPAFHRGQIAAYADAMVEQADRLSSTCYGMTGQRRSIIRIPPWRPYPQRAPPL